MIVVYWAKKKTMRKLHTHTQARAFALNAVVCIVNARARTSVSNIHRRNYTVHFTQNEKKTELKNDFKSVESAICTLCIVCVCTGITLCLYETIKASSISWCDTHIRRVYISISRDTYEYDRMRSFPSFVAFTSFLPFGPSIATSIHTMLLADDVHVADERTHEQKKNNRNGTKRLLL